MDPMTRTPEGAKSLPRLRPGRGHCRKSRAPWGAVNYIEHLTRERVYPDLRGQSEIVR